MPIDRRTFMLGSGLGVTVASLAASLAPSRVVAGPLPDPSADLAPAGQAQLDAFAFRIHGWDDSSNNVSQGKLEASPWISLDHSWRAAWR